MSVKTFMNGDNAGWKAAIRLVTVVTPIVGIFMTCIGVLAVRELNSIGTRIDRSNVKITELTEHVNHEITLIRERVSIVETRVEDS